MYLSCTVSEIFYYNNGVLLKSGSGWVEDMDQESIVMNKDFQIFAFHRTMLLPQWKYETKLCSSATKMGLVINKLLI